MNSYELLHENEISPDFLCEEIQRLIKNHRNERITDEQFLKEAKYLARTYKIDEYLNE